MPRATFAAPSQGGTVPARAGEPLLSLAFLLSGAAGLIFQVVWFHRAGLVLGNSLAAVTIVLSSFMAGLALGNLLASSLASRSSPIRTYMWLELVVGGCGFAVSVLLPRLTVVIAPLLRLLPEGSPLVNLVRLGTAFAVLVVPATAMGATLPVLVGAIARRRGGFGRVLGRLYGWNTVGAVAGVLGAELVTIAIIGMTGTAALAATLNLLAAALAAVASRAWRNVAAVGAPSSNAEATPDSAARVPRALFVAAGLAGALLLSLEVLWFRFLSLYVLSTTLAVSIMLAVVLAGIAAGGWIAAGWLRADPSARRFVPTLSFAAGTTVALAYVAFQWTTSGTQIGEWYRVLWLACALTLPTSVVSGALFTLLGDTIREGEHDDTRAAARLTLANTGGALIGPLIATFVLLPSLGLESSVFVLSVAYGAMGAIVTHAFRRTASRVAPPRVTLVATGSLIAVLALFTFAAGRGGYFQRAADAYAADGSRIVAVREGPSETIFLMQQLWMARPVYSRLVTNGFSMTGTAVPGQRYMRYFAYWPMFVHEGPIARALLVCYGAGVTASALLQIPSLQSLDIAEISRDVAAMSDLIYAPDRHPLHDDRVKLHIEDGRYLLETTRDRFDVITGEPPPPRTPGTVNIYTREFFQLVFDHLNDGGIATYWLPVGRPQPGTDVDTIIRAFCDVFTDCSLWNATPFDFMLAGTRGARGPLTREQFAQPWQTPGLQETLRGIGFERPEQIGATFLGDAGYLNELTADVPPLTDNFPQRLRPGTRPSLSDPRYGIDAAVRSRFADVLDPARSRRLFPASPFVLHHWPESLINASDRYFDYQRWLNDTLWNGARPLAQIAELDALLTSTTLRTLPLWILGSDDVKQAIAESVDDGTGMSDYAKGLRGLSGRDYLGAAALFQRAEQRGVHVQTLRPLLAYALLKGGRADEARQLAEVAKPSTNDEKAFWSWIQARLKSIDVRSTK